MDLPVDLPALLESTGVYDERFPVCSDSRESLVKLAMTIPRPPLTCYRLQHDIRASSDQKCHVLPLVREADLITRFEVKNAHVVLVLNGFEVADITEKCVLPVVSLPYYTLALHVYPLNHDEPVRISALQVLLQQGRDRDEICVGRALICGSFAVQDGLVHSGLRHSL